MNKRLFANKQSFFTRRPLDPKILPHFLQKVKRKINIFLEKYKNPKNIFLKKFKKPIDILKIKIYNIYVNKERGKEKIKKLFKKVLTRFNYYVIIIM